MRKCLTQKFRVALLDPALAGDHLDGSLGCVVKSCLTRVSQHQPSSVVAGWPGVVVAGSGRVVGSGPGARVVVVVVVVVPLVGWGAEVVPSPICGGWRRSGGSPRHSPHRSPRRGLPSRPGGGRWRVHPDAVTTVRKLFFLPILKKFNPVNSEDY